MFAGYATLDGTFQNLLLTGLAGLASAPDSPPTFKVYGPSGAMPGATGTCVKFDVDDGLYEYSFPVPGSGGYEVAVAYTVVFRYAYQGANYLQSHLFMVT